MDKILNLLVIEDSEADFLLIERHLRQSGLHARCRRATSLDELSIAMDAGSWDVILSDYSIPRLDFLESFALIQARLPDVPVILVSGSIGEEKAVELLKLGICDFILKDSLVRLAPAIRRSIEEAAERRARRAAEGALRESEEHYRSLFENMLNGVALCRMIFEQGRPTDFTYLEVNTAFETLTGLRDVVGKNVSEIIPGIREADPELFEIYGRVALTGVPARFETHVASLANWFSVSVYSPRKEHFVAVFDVITERKRAEEALRHSEERFRQIAESLPQLVWTSLPEGPCDYLSRQWVEYTGVPADEHLGLGWLEQIHPDDRARLTDAWSASVSTGSPFHDEFRIRRRDGSYRWLDTRAMPLRDSEGRIVKWFGSNTDIHEQRETRDALRDSLEEKVALLKEVHHRVKNNLQIVASLLNLQANRMPNPQVAGLLLDTRNRVHSMALLHELLYSSGSLARINFASYVEKLCGQLLHSFGPIAGRVRVESRVARMGLPLELAVPCGLIINELVSNALKHGFPDERSGRIDVELRPAGVHGLSLCVRDDGVGAPPGFDPLTASTLGLKLVSNLAGQLGGHLTVGGPDSVGSAFCVVFPVPENMLSGDES